MAEIQENERQIPLLTVLKNNCILKNIYLLNNPPSISPSSTQDSQIEDTLLVGRHPDCNIKLEHPSISRFHLRIHSLPSSRSLYVTDLSSVHGTWISGQKVEPEVKIKLNEGDTFQLGGSSRLYRLHWIPLSRAYDLDNPFVPRLDVVEEETEGDIHQDENNLSDTLGGLELLPMETLSPPAPMVCGNLYNSFCSDEVEEKKESPEVEYEEACQFEKENSTSIQEVEEKKESPEVEYGEACQFEKENSTPRALFTSLDSQLATQTESKESSAMNSGNRSNMSIWSRRSKPESVKIETVARVSFLCDSVHLNYETESVMENHCVSPDQHDQIFTPEKENHCVSPDQHDQILTPEKENGTPSSLFSSSLTKKDEDILKSASIFNSPSSVDWPSSVDLETFTPDKENMTPNTRILGSIKKIGNLEEVETGAESDLKTHYVGSGQEEQIFTPEKENRAPNSLLFSSLKKKGKEILNSASIFDSPAYSDEEIFTPDKENMTPNTLMLRSMKKIGNLEEVEVEKSKSYRSSPLKRASNRYMNQEDTIENQHQNILQQSKTCSSVASMKKKKTVLKARVVADREPFRPLPVNSIREPFRPLPVNSIVNNQSNSKSSDGQLTKGSSKSIIYPEYEDVSQPHNKTKMEEKKTWTIIVDTACLLNKKSRKELQLLRGLKGTSMIIPRIAVRELDCMLKRGSFFRRTTEVSAALQWIEDCMANTKEWIHVQTSAEESGLIPPTPPASSSHWFNEDKSAFQIGTNPFSPYSLQEIVTPTAEDHILDCALFFKRSRNGSQLVLLSDDVTLKIKAMAEGVICETAEEFRGSLVNPFSERFLYVDSSPRGPTWSCADDAVLKEKYYPSPSKKLSKSVDGVKGLKLILLHNSSFSQIKQSG